MSDKIIVLGLCNPGKEFDMSFHNVGSAAINSLIEAENMKMNQAGKYAFAEAENTIFAYSRSEYMNDSGKIVLMLKQRYNFDNEHLIVIHDEVMLPLGQIKCTFAGSAKGHNGLRDIAQKIGTNFFHIKIGVGHPGKGADLGKYLTTKVRPALFNLCINNFLETFTLDKFEKIVNTKP